MIFPSFPCQPNGCAGYGTQQDCQFKQSRHLGEWHLFAWTNPMATLLWDQPITSSECMILTWIELYRRMLAILMWSLALFISKRPISMSLPRGIRYSFLYFEWMNLSIDFFLFLHTVRMPHTEYSHLGSSYKGTLSSPSFQLLSEHNQQQEWIDCTRYNTKWTTTS